MSTCKKQWSVRLAITELTKKTESQKVDVLSFGVVDFCDLWGHKIYFIPRVTFVLPECKELKIKTIKIKSTSRPVERTVGLSDDSCHWLP